ncbi:hypothetical protein [uncultured Rhizobium sp.]|uniref:hypothetical protein n=1 Tax=unclassified Neorhizobium TaxID=2629175 RepID=UPI002D7E6B8A|nr:hypothetical protein [uncultured Rhizobium sp.]
MSLTDANILRMEPIWQNGSLTFKVTYPSAAIYDYHQINRLADQAGYLRSGTFWTPPKRGPAMMKFSQALSRIGLKLRYDPRQMMLLPTSNV